MPDLSRRAILRGATFAGAAAVGGAAGVSTHSLLVDGELFESNSLQSGALNLELATSYELGDETTYVPAQDSEASFPSAFADESNITLWFPNLDPDDGPEPKTMTVAFRACDNPGRIWLRANGEQSDLADALYVQVSYATECGADGTVLYEGRLSGFLDDFGGGVRLYEHCTVLGKIEYDDGDETLVVEGSGDSLPVDKVPGTLTFETDDGDIDVRIVGVHEKDGSDEVIGVDIQSDDVEFCRVDVKGGGKQNTSGNNTGGSGGGGGNGKGGGNSKKGGTGSDGNGNGSSGADPSDGVETYWLNCASAPSELLAGEGPSGNQSGLSHLTLYACGEETCLDCEPECLTVDWELLDADGLAGDSLAIDLELFANQCRHTEPTNPWQ